MININSKIFLTGHKGMLGSSILRILKKKGYKNIIIVDKKKLDLRNQKSVNKFLGFKMNIVRPSNAYCSGQLLHRIIPRSFVSILKGEKIPLHGGGKAEKSYMHAIDLAEAIMAFVVIPKCS